MRYASASQGKSLSIVSGQEVIDQQLLIQSALSYAKQGEYHLSLTLINKALCSTQVRMSREKKKVFLAQVWELIHANFSQRTLQYASACNSFRTGCMQHKFNQHDFDLAFIELQLMHQTLNGLETSILSAYSFAESLISGEHDITKEALNALAECFYYQVTMY